jgi:hypothetical protein
VQERLFFSHCSLFQSLLHSHSTWKGVDIDALKIGGGANTKEEEEDGEEEPKRVARRNKG